MTHIYVPAARTVLGSLTKIVGGSLAFAGTRASSAPLASSTNRSKAHRSNTSSTLPPRCRT